MKTESSGMIARLKANRIMAFLVLCLIGFVVIIGFMVAKLLTYSSSDQHLKGLISELRASSYQLSTLARDATDAVTVEFSGCSHTLSADQTVHCI